MSKTVSNWSIEGESEDGSPGEDCYFGIGITEDGTGWIVGGAEYGPERFQLSLAVEDVAALRAALSRTTQPCSEER